MAKPKEVFYVEQSGAKLRYGQKGGGLFARLDGAEGRAEMMRRQGATVKVYRATVVWDDVTDCLHNWEYGDGVRACAGCGAQELSN